MPERARGDSVIVGKDESPLCCMVGLVAVDGVHGAHRARLMSLALISALLALVAASIYILGLIALCWPIYRRITNDASTALYAVSLMPKTVVAGQGVMIFFGLPFLMTLTVVVGLGVGTSVVRALLPLVPTRLGDQAITVLVWSIVIVGVFMFFNTRSVDVFEPRGVRGLAVHIGISAMIVASTLSIALIYGVFFYESGTILPRASDWYVTIATLIFVFALNSVGGLVFAFTRDAPLPDIKVVGSDTDEQGKLVAHAEGVWYLLEADTGTLIGIPDEKADRVDIYPSNSS